jgi:hypothetical protein
VLLCFATGAGRIRKAPYRVLATADKVYFTDSDGNLNTYDTATATKTTVAVLDGSIPSGGDDRTLYGLALHPTSAGVMYVLANVPPAAGIYSVDLTNTVPPAKLVSFPGWTDDPATGCIQRFQRSANQRIPQSHYLQMGYLRVNVHSN